MKNAWLGWIGCLCILSSCVTERVGSSNTGDEFLKRNVANIVERLPFESGMELYNDCRRLIAYGNYAVEPMRECLKSENSQVRSTAAFVLGQLKKPETIEDLRPLTHDENKLVRLEAARALLEIGVWDTIPILIEGLGYGESTTRQLCIEVLAGKTGERFGFEVDGTEENRQVAIKRWQDWWETKRNDPNLQASLDAH